MEKKVAVAIDPSVHAMEASHYAAQMAAENPGLRFVLLHVQPAISLYLTDEARRNHKARMALEKAIEQNQAKANEILDAASERMAAKGVEAGHIEKLTIQRNIGVADDILALSQAKDFDAILVGRRGASYLREWVMGSVTANLIEHSRVTPIWVVDGKVASPRVLLAADGSQCALRALDHMAFILSGHADPTIHVVHVQPRFQDYCEIKLPEETVQNAEAVFRQDDQNCMDDFYQQAQAVLDKNGVSPERLQLQSLEASLSVPRTVIQYARQNDFGTIVMGRRGRSNSLFTGSVSRSLLHKTSNLGLWVVP
jgi:nucleotide-binding universal stress UspA family protein